MKSLFFLLSVICLASLFSPKVVFAKHDQAPQFHPSPYGMMGFTYSHAEDDPRPFERADEYMDLYKQSGSRWDRRDFWWNIVQPEKDQWEWEYFDRAMEDFQKNNVNLVAILCYGSNWKGASPSTDEEIEQYGEYVFQMVNRYKGWVKHWEIWNEPNILPFWTPKPDWEAYTRMLKVAYTRAKEADPDCVILGGATAGADEKFLRVMYENGNKGYFDAFSYHTYGNNPTPEGQLAEIEKLQAVMREYDDEKPLWITETGIYTGPIGLSDQLQAERIAKSQIFWVSYGIERIFQLTLKNWTDDPNAENATSSFRGITYNSGKPKPALYAFRTLNDLLGDKDYIGSPQLHPGLIFHYFQSKEQNCLAVWADEGEEVEVSLPLGVSTVMRYNLFGEKELVVTEKGIYTTTITQEPVYFEGVGEEVTFAAGWKTGTVQEAVAAGDNVKWQVSFEDASGLISDVEMTPENSSVVDFAGLSLKSEVDGGAFNAMNLLLVDPEAPIGESVYSYVVSGKTKYGMVGPVTLYGVVDVENPIELRFAPFDSLSLPVGLIELEIHNRSLRTVSGDFELEWSDAFDQIGPEKLVLESGQMHTLPVLYDGNKAESGKVYEAEATLTVEDVVTTAGVVLRPLNASYLDSSITIDGDLSDWRDSEKNITEEMMTEVDFNPAHNGGAADLAASGWLAWDDEAVYLALELHDDVICLPSDTVIWEWDSLQVGFDGLNDAVPGTGYGKSDYELAIAKLVDGTNLIYAGHYPQGFIERVVKEETELAIKVDEDKGTIVYEMRIPQPVIPSIELKTGTVFGFNFIQNENDENSKFKREGWMALSPGIGWGKHPDTFRDVILWGGNKGR